jgi:glycosidase
MTKNPVSGIWYKWVRLKVGGGSTSHIAGAYQYKFNENGCSTCWLSDPLNQRVNLSDAGNSYLFIKDPTIFHFIPNQRNPVVNTSVPTISAYIFPKAGSVVDTSSLSLTVDGTVYTQLGSMYNFTTMQFVYTPISPLPNGSHTAILHAETLAGGANADTVLFYVQSGFVQLLNQSPITTWESQWTLYGSVNDSTITSVSIVRNSTDTFLVSAAGKSFTYSASLLEGSNVFSVVTDSAGAPMVSAPITIYRKMNHSPWANISFSDSSGGLRLSALSSTDPDSGQSALLTYSWSVDPANPSAVTGVSGSIAGQISISKPSISGEYYFGLIATDPDGNKDTTRNYFTVNGDGTVSYPTLASNPSWVNRGRMYLLFFKSATTEGTINAALPRLDYIKSMGYNIVWIMPVMKNASPMDNMYGTGYNIVDFYDVAPEYGSNEDFKDFVARAHQLGLKVIQDITPNHTSSMHPFVLDIRSFRKNSRYWNFYQHQLITNPNYHPDLTEAYTDDSLFVRYYAFGDMLLNYNWSDLDARNYMVDVYKWWVKEMGVDGFRFDVYWGPHSRANGGNGGENEMGQPVRTALKHIKPDVFLLGETDGTGIGTEVVYGDRSGGVDAGYDWNLFHNGVQNFYSSGPQINTLNFYLLNGGSTTMGFEPGPNAYFMRFLEDQDEDRIAYVYGSFAKTMPVSSIVLTSVGIPLVYSGQEVGWGFGITGAKEARNRSVIDWTYNGKVSLQPHYQKLAQLRAQFSPFWTQQQIRVTTGNNFVLGYTRPLNDLNGIVLSNFDSNPQGASVTLATSGTPNVFFSHGVVNGRTYYASDLYNDTVYNITFDAGSATLSVNLQAYGSAVLVLDETTHTLLLPPITDVKTSAVSVPRQFVLYQNYPNPFNPTTRIEFDVPTRSNVTLKVYDVLGREVATLVNSAQSPGHHVAVWDVPRNGVASGVYFYQLTSENVRIMRKMLLIR